MKPSFPQLFFCLPHAFIPATRDSCVIRDGIRDSGAQAILENIGNRYLCELELDNRETLG